jgi:hypothetical protein
VRPVVEDVFVSPMFPADSPLAVEALPVALLASIEAPSEVSVVEPVDVPVDAPVIPVVPSVVKFPLAPVFTPPMLLDGELPVPGEPKLVAFCLTRKRFSTCVTPEMSSVMSSAIRFA